jgi:ribonuclease HII
LVGVDEAGRGPLAGPVVVAAVVLPEVPHRDFGGITDSKLMTPKALQSAFGVVVRRALSVSVAWAHHDLIDEHNILRATLQAMARAAARSARRVGGHAFAIVDGPHKVPDLPFAHEPVVDGDAKSLSIACASVVAKVTRDRWMERMHRRFPGYGFDSHKGYATESHRAALMALGPCRIHRRSYEPVRLAEAALAR